MSSDFGNSPSSIFPGIPGGRPGNRPDISLTWVGQNPGASLIVRLVDSWDQGDPVPAERLIADHPQIDETTAVELIYEEINLKREAGFEVRTAEVYRQFPQYETALKAVLEFDRLLDFEGVRGRFPKPGDRLGPFELISVLGEGASGRTYVALESSLADRPVVLKVMPVGHVEHLNLARLQHTHIMPLYSEMVLDDQGLRILVMPYLGGSGLDRILKNLGSKDFSKRSGRDILETIDRTSLDDASRTTVSGTSRAFFEQASYADAIAHIGMCLADAAAEAHTRGLVHMDIKPSNVLISADARPVLLDFHLARAPVRLGDRSVDRLGGTPGWTSPEQNACFQAAASGLAMPTDIDGRSDIYAIGAIMARALRTDDGSPGKSPVFAPEVSVGLGDIVRKCLASDPAGRYPNASELAEDLRLHLAHAPLRGVSNRSVLERLSKWRARNPTGIVWILAAGILISAIGFSLLQIDRARLKTADDIRTTIEDAHRLELAGLHDNALERLERVKAEALNLPGLGSGIVAIESTKTQMRQSKSLAELNAKSEQFRLAFRSRNLSRESRATITEDCRAIWNARNDLIQAAEIASDQTRETRGRVERQLIEIAVLLAELTFRDDDPDSRKAATAILGQAEELFGPQFAILLARISIDSRAALRRDVSLPPSNQPTNAWEYDQLGRFHSKNGRSAEAAGAFEKAVSLEPGQFWYQFDLAKCRHDRAEWQKSITAWAAAVALRPDSAVCRFDRGLTFEAMGRFDDALADFLAAYDLDKNLSIAASNAAILKQRRGEENEALKLLEQVAHTARDERTKKMAWARIVAIHIQAGRKDQARDAIRAAAALGLIVGDPNSILQEN